jgi:LysR family hydrogen peroxide-inducible transcriptional activator
MTIQQLKYALALEEHGHFQKAAEHCFVTQPTLSQQIQKLEDDLGIVLFDRSRQPILPTHDGMLILRQIHTALLELERIDEKVKDLRNEVQGVFRLAVIPTLAAYIIPRFLKDFTTAYPKVQLRIDESQTDKIVEDLTHGHVDAALLVTPLENPSLVEEPLFYETIWLYLCAGHPLLRKVSVKESDLSIDDVYLLAEGHCFRGQVLHLCKTQNQRRPRSVQIESGSLETVKRLVDQGEGSTLLPELAKLDLVTREQEIYLRPFAQPQPYREVSLVSYRHSIKRAIREGLRERILKNLPKTVERKTPGRAKVLPL